MSTDLNLNEIKYTFQSFVDIFLTTATPQSFNVTAVEPFLLTTTSLPTSSSKAFNSLTGGSFLFDGKLVQNVSFRKIIDPFLNTVKKDLRNITSSKKIYVFADKTKNIYEVPPTEYNKLLTENVTKPYS